jgi:hypothetical protein
LLLKSEATWGRKTYTLALTRLAEQYGRRAKEPELTEDDRAWNERKAAHTTVLRQWIEGVMASVSEPTSGAGGAVALTSLVECATAFLEANAARANALDAMPYVAVAEAGDGISCRVEPQGSRARRL